MASQHDLVVIDSSPLLQDVTLSFLDQSDIVFAVLTLVTGQWRGAGELTLAAYGWLAVAVWIPMRGFGVTAGPLDDDLVAGPPHDFNPDAAVLGGVLLATALFLREGLSRRDWREAYDRFRANLGRGILLGLELLVGADIIATVTAPLTFESVGLLAVVVLIRTFLSFSLETEIEGRWPWRRAEAKRNAAPEQPKVIRAHRQRLHALPLDLHRPHRPKVRHRHALERGEPQAAVR